MDLKKFYIKNAVFLWISAIILIIFIIVVGTIVFPDLFYDQWIWQYYWGPVVSDAAGETVWHNGIAANEGYTWISEITYGIILIIALFGIYKLLKKLQIIVDWRFCLALLPYIVFGPVTRVLEDAEYFNEPFVYWFISPFIYLQIAVYALGFLLLGSYLVKKSKKPTDTSVLLYSLLIFVILDISYTIIWFSRVSYGTYILHPVVFYILTCVSFLPILYRFVIKKLTPNIIMFSGGLFFLLPSLYLIGRWIVGEQWAYSEGVRFDVFILIVGVVCIVTFFVFLVSYVFRERKHIAVYKEPLNLALIFGHMVDGISSYISIYDPLQMGLPLYSEKHPASTGLMDVWPPLFPIVKFILIVVVIYLFDVLYKKELAHHRHLVNLLKIGILILGLSPGLRDLLRVTMGV